MHDPLATLLADGVIDEVCGRLKSGKEADLWLVRHGGEVVAAKIYKARHARSFRNNASYKEGRQVRDTRTQRAMDRGTRFGQAAAEEDWKAKESDALHRLHAAGVRVPTPVLYYDGVLLMELVLDPHGRPAPRLVDAHVERETAAALYADLRGQATRMLACDLIHGDLSPYNVLLGRSGPVVIDFPQVVGAAHNSQAESFFRRDIENLRRFFEAVDPSLRAAANDAHEIWRAYVRRELTPDFVPSGKVHAAPQRHGRGHDDARRGGHAHARPGHAPARHRQPHERQGREASARQGPPHDPQARAHASRAHPPAQQQQHESREVAAPHESRGHAHRPVVERPHGERPHGEKPHSHRGHGGGPQRPHDGRPPAHGPRQPDGRARDGRRGAAPMPEVIRVTRPLAANPTTPSAPAPTPGGARRGPLPPEASGATRREDDAHPHRGHRRRRR